MDGEPRDLLAGGAIGHRPLLTLGALLITVGVQFLFLGLVSEMITSQHAEGRRRAAVERNVREVL